jgi:beta-lactamase superfamily II metal-dependent hydrolase
LVTLHKDTLSVHILNVGDGDSVVVELPEEAGSRSHLVIDCYDGDKTTEYLEKLDAKRLRLVVATHPHQDHIAGLLSVLKAFPNNVEQFWDSGFRHTSATWFELVDYLKGKPEILFLRPTSGLSTLMSGVEITVLAPSIYLRNRYDTYGVNINNASIVLKLTYAEHSAILAADAQWDSWAKMTEEFPHFEKTTDPLQRIKIQKDYLPLKCHSMKVAHHGSKHGTALEAMERLRPKYAAISCAKPSRHEFPHELATGALKDLDTTINTTAEGSIVYTFESNGKYDAHQYNDTPNQTPPAPTRT